ncbi:MAG: glycosyltransferase family 2 protein [Muribaculaceae bacterium]|nr:glycosyltransferase family 2 protein [Muribaculaceae bacterium]
MENYLPQCLDSLLIPELSRIEILVINDGSKDRTSEIAHEYELRYPGSIRVIDKENGNYGSCINTGLKILKGKYVKILDADDSFDKDTFSRYVEFLNVTDADAVINDHVVVTPRYEVTETHSFKMLKPNICMLTDDMMDIFPFQEISMHGIAYRSSIFKDLDYHQTEGISYTDDEWIFSPLTKVNTVAYFPLPLYRYLLGRDGQTVNESTLQRNIHHISITLMKMLEIYHGSAGLGAFQDKYLKERIERKAVMLYTICILTSQKNISFNLSKFDSELKTKYPDLYMLIEDFSIRALMIMNIKYAKVWRKSGAKAIQLRMLRLWIEIKKKLKI